MTAAPTGPCECCQRQNAILGPVRAPNGLPAANRICAICLRHLGDATSIARRREAQHAEMWAEDQREALQALEERHSRILDGLQQQIARLRQTLEDRPERVVVENLDLHEVREAHTARDGAYRATPPSRRCASSGCSTTTPATSNVAAESASTGATSQRLSTATRCCGRGRASRWST